MKPTAEQSDFIERIGRWWERAGTRSAGRILGWLMICDPAHRSASQLVDELQLSAGSVSTQTTALEQMGLVERTTFPGDRASYYRLRPHVWMELMAARQGELIVLKELADAGREILPQESPDRVTDLHMVASFFLDEWPGILERLSERMETEKDDE